MSLSDSIGRITRNEQGGMAGVTTIDNARQGCLVVREHYLRFLRRTLAPMAPTPHPDQTQNDLFPAAA